MTWKDLAPIIAQNGIPWAYQFWQIVTTHTEPSEEAWAKLLTLSQTPMLDYVNAARAKIGLPPLTSYDPATDPGAPSKP